SLFFLLVIPHPPRSTLFPYTTLFRSLPPGGFKQEYFIPNVPDSGLLTDDEIRKLVWRHWPRVLNERRVGKSAQRGTRVGREGWPDRKSTRLNSSHVSISYAVFCLKKK